MASSSQSLSIVVGMCVGTSLAGVSLYIKGVSVSGAAMVGLAAVAGTIGGFLHYRNY